MSKIVIFIIAIIMIVGVPIAFVENDKPKLVDTIDKVIKVEYIQKNAIGGSEKIIIYTKNKVYIFDNIDYTTINSINIGGSTSVYKNWGYYYFKSEKLK